MLAAERRCDFCVSAAVTSSSVQQLIQQCEQGPRPVGACWCPWAQCRRLQGRSPSSRVLAPSRSKLTAACQRWLYQSQPWWDPTSYWHLLAFFWNSSWVNVQSASNRYPGALSNRGMPCEPAVHPTELLYTASTGSVEKGLHNRHLHETVHAVMSAVSLCATTESPLRLPQIIYFMLVADL